MPLIHKPVNLEFFNDPAVKGLVHFSEGADGHSYYRPRDGQEALGPVVGARDFVSEHFGAKETLPMALMCDPGTDDALAIVLALHARSRSKFKLVMPSFGNVGPDVTYHNSLRMISLCNAFGVVVGKGAQGPMGSDILPENAAGEHGEDGFGGAVERNREEVEANIGKIAQYDDGVNLLVENITSRYDRGIAPITIVSTGSLTDLALTLLRLEKEKPAALSKIRGVSMMGGGIDTQEWHTNVTPFAEFNMYQDPQAAKIVFDKLAQHNIPTIMIPLDLTHQTSVREDYEGAWLAQMAEQYGSDVGHFVAQLMKAGGFDIERSEEIFKLPSVSRFMHDPNTISILDRPDLFGGFRARVEVIAEGERAGQTVVKADRNGNVFVPVEVDAAGLIADWQTKFSTFQCKPSLML